MMKEQMIKAVTTEQCKMLQGTGRRVVVQHFNGAFLLHKISDIANPKRMVNVSRHATIWLKNGDFTLEAA